MQAEVWRERPASVGLKCVIDRGRYKSKIKMPGFRNWDGTKSSIKSSVRDLLFSFRVFVKTFFNQATDTINFGRSLQDLFIQTSLTSHLFLHHYRDLGFTTLLRLFLARRVLILIDT